MQFVADDVNLLLGLQAVLSRGLQEELRGDVLQRGDLPLAAAQLVLQSLQAGGDREQQSASPPSIKAAFTQLDADKQYNSYVAI